MIVTSNWCLDAFLINTKIYQIIKNVNREIVCHTFETLLFLSL